jgi:hypothetical protein
MNRRDLNRILMVGTALAGSWPGWLKKAFGADAASGRACPTAGHEGEQRWRQIVSGGYRRAQQAGKPLLAFVVPAVDEDSGDGFDARWDRGAAFGELLNHGSDDALATLGLAEVVCAPMEVLRVVARGLPARGEPLMVLIETDAVPGRVRVLDGSLPRVPDRRTFLAAAPQPADYRTTFARLRDAEKEGVGTRIEFLASLLDGGLRATPQMLLERAAQAQARLGLNIAAGAEANAGPAELHRMGALLLASAVALPEGQRQAAVRRMADATRYVLCRRRVPGSRWSNAGGCGDDPEYEPGEREKLLGDGVVMVVGCGMGHVPELSSRFLDFLSRDARWRS